MTRSRTFRAKSGTTCVATALRTKKYSSKRAQASQMGSPVSPCTRTRPSVRRSPSRELPEVIKARAQRVSLLLKQAQNLIFALYLIRILRKSTSFFATTLLASFHRHLRYESSHKSELRPRSRVSSTRRFTPHFLLINALSAVLRYSSVPSEQFRL